MELSEALVRIGQNRIKVGEFRRQMEVVWATPDFHDCIVFAHSESGEVSDAEMRQKPQYTRNNHRTPSVTDEKADTALMCLSALWVWGPHWQQNWLSSLQWYYNPLRADVFVAEAKFNVKIGRTVTALQNVVDALVCMYQDEEFDLDVELERKLNVFRGKYLPQEEK